MAMGQTSYTYKCNNSRCKYIMQFDAYQGFQKDCPQCGQMMLQKMDLNGSSGGSAKEDAPKKRINETITSRKSTEEKKIEKKKQCVVTDKVISNLRN